MIVGLTGQSGAGKSTVAALFAEAGFRIIDCDALVHTLYGESRYVHKIAEVFGKEYVKDGVVDRKKLGTLGYPLVFGGAFASMFPERFLNLGGSYVIRADGEIPMVKLANAMLAGEDPSGNPSLCYKKDCH